MSPAGLVVANLFRKPTRTTLTLVSLAVAFLLFVLLRAIAVAFAGGGPPPFAQRIYVDARYSMTDNLPVAHLDAIRRIEGVASATPMIWFGGYYQDPANDFAKIPVDPVRFFEVFPEVRVSEATRKRFATVRRAVIAADSLAQRYGWSPGDIIPIVGDIWPRADGSWNWEFELAGTYSVPAGSRVQTMLLMRQDHFDESVTDWVKSQFGWAVVRVAPGADTKRVIDAIDTHFENSADPTRSLSEDDYSRQFASQLGDIGAITTLILGAVFFTILLLTANVVALSFRERTAEIAVLKTLGFRNGQVAAFVLTEAVALCSAGAVVGTALAYALEPLLGANLQSVVGPFRIRESDAFAAFGIATVMGICIGAPSAIRAGQLSIVGALRAEV
jgi:putative ABC transport system permease protein